MIRTDELAAKQNQRQLLLGTIFYGNLIKNHYSISISTFLFRVLDTLSKFLRNMPCYALIPLPLVFGKKNHQNAYKKLHKAKKTPETSREVSWNLAINFTWNFVKLQNKFHLKLPFTRHPVVEHPCITQASNIEKPTFSKTKWVNSTRVTKQANKMTIPRVNFN